MGAAIVSGANDNALFLRKKANSPLDIVCTLSASAPMSDVWLFRGAPTKGL